DEHPGTSLVMKALNHPDMKNYTLIAEKDLADGSLLMITKGQFDDNMIVQKNSTSLVSLKPSEIDHYLALNDDNGGPWKIYPTTGGAPVYASMSGAKPSPSPTPGVSAPQVITSFAAMDKLPWIPGDIVATREDGKWRITYNDESKFVLEVNDGTADSPKWTSDIIATDPQSSLLGHFPLDAQNMTTKWYAGQPGGNDSTFSPTTGSPNLQTIVWSNFNSNAGKNEILATATNADNDAYIFIKKVKPSGASYIEVQKNNEYNN